MALSRKVLASWYLQIAQHLEAGLSLSNAIEQSGGPPPADRSRMAVEIESGRPLDDVLRHAPTWFPYQDRIFVSAAAQTGRLPQTLQKLAERHRRIGANQLKAILGTLYPLGILHLGALIIPLISMINFEQGFRWNTIAYVSQVSTVLIPLWLLIAIVISLARSSSPFLHRILRLLPILRGYSKAQALANFCYALGTFLDTGIPPKRAWQGAAALSQDPAILQAERNLNPLLEQGRDPAEALAQYTCFPPDFVSYYQAGTRNGQLDANLLRLAGQYQDTANNRMTFASILYPSLLFAAVAAWIITAIFRVFGNYLEALNSILS